MEMLDASVMKQNNEEYQKRLTTLKNNLLRRAASDRNFLSNPKEVGKMISNTMYAEDGRNISDVLMVRYLHGYYRPLAVTSQLQLLSAMLEGKVKA